MPVKLFSFIMFPVLLSFSLSLQCGSLVPRPSASSALLWLVRKGGEPGNEANSVVCHKNDFSCTMHNY